ncbi:hypothetical protein CIB48_g429 [Xylaria polymorpha]|nr:hypothetical protein CIB48_g429 [Xylaria polymorpha]
MIGEALKQLPTQVPLTGHLQYTVQIDNIDDRVNSDDELPIDYMGIMSATESDPEDAVTKEEITGTAAAPEPSSAGVSRGTKRNAFAELMAPKPKKPHEVPTLASTRSAFTGGFKARDGLGAYTADPASFPASRVIYHNESFVAINDLYPKSTVHTLLLPRSPRSRLHPFDAFEDPEFLASVQAETARLKRLAAKELQRRYGRFSAQEKEREAVLNGGRGVGGRGTATGWARLGEGIARRRARAPFHERLTRAYSIARHAADDPRRHPGRAGYLNGDMRCWRCGKNFGNQFKKLKDHLTGEFEDWKKQ